MGLKFVHTADWHLGRTYARIGPRAHESGQWRLEAVRRIWELAAEQRADFILVAGDVFHTDTPNPKLMNQAVQLLRDAPAPAILIAGNHDPCAEGSVWFHSDFADALKGVSNVRLATARQPLALPECDALVFPCPVAARHTREDVTNWIPTERRASSAQVRVGLAHGGWKGYWGETGDAPNSIDGSCTDRCGLDYLALGDYHSHTLPDHPAAKARAYYAGTPECGDRDDARPGYALVVELNEAGGEPIVQPHCVGRVRPHDLGEVILRGESDFATLRATVEQIERPEDVLLRAKLKGCLPELLKKEIERWINEAREKLLGADIETRDLCAEPCDDDFLALHLEAPESCLLDLLHAPLSDDELEGVRDAQTLAAWSTDEAARREARALFYQLLRS